MKMMKLTVREAAVTRVTELAGGLIRTVRAGQGADTDWNSRSLSWPGGWFGQFRTLEALSS